GVRKDAYENMGFPPTGMECAPEMGVKSPPLNLRMAEVPPTLPPDGRTRPPHLRTWRDGWRTLRFFLLYSPRWLFLHPGLAMMAIGTLLGLWLLPAPRRIGNVTFDVHTLVYAAAFVLLGFQAIAFSGFPKLFAISECLRPAYPGRGGFFGYSAVEGGLVAGGFMVVGGLVSSISAVGFWEPRHFGALDYPHTMRIVIPAALFLILGVQTVFSSFFLSVLGLRRR